MGKLRTFLTTKSGAQVRENAALAAYISSSRGHNGETGDSSVGSGQTDQLVELLMDLSEERKKTARLQQQLHAILDINTETRCAAKMETEEERQMRMKAESQAKEANERLVEAQMKVANLQKEKEVLEAELMEAASQILEQQALRQALQDGIEAEKVAWKTHDENSTVQIDGTEHQASATPTTMPLTKISLQESKQWEELQALLQETTPEPFLKGGAIRTLPKRANSRGPAPSSSSKPGKDVKKVVVPVEDKEKEVDPAIHVDTPSADHESSIDQEHSSEQEPDVDEESSDEEDRNMQLKAENYQKDAKKSQIIQWMDTFADVDVEELERISPDDKIGFKDEPQPQVKNESNGPVADDSAYPETPEVAVEGHKLDGVAGFPSSNVSVEEASTPDEADGLITLADFISPAKESNSPAV